MDVIKYKPIGIIHSPFKEPKGTPIQPTGAKHIDATVELFPEYVEGLKDLEGFSHIILIYHFHLSKHTSLRVRLVRVQGNILHIQDVDAVDGTPLLDIKPYVPEFDTREVYKIGWLEKRVHGLSKTKNNGRFIK